MGQAYGVLAPSGRQFSCRSSDSADEDASNFQGRQPIRKVPRADNNPGGTRVLTPEAIRDVHRVADCALNCEIDSRYWGVSSGRTFPVEKPNS